MKRRLNRLALVGLTVALAAAVGVSPASAKTTTIPATFTQCVSSGAAITDHSSNRVLFPITVPKNKGAAQLGTVTDVNAGLRFDHTFDADTVATVIGPGGASAALELGRTGTSNGYGTGVNSCAGSLVLFDDLFLTPISTVPNTEALVIGSFKPDQLLSAFNGGPAAGTWSIVVTDSANGDTGVFGGASLTVQYTYLQTTKKKKKKKKK